MPSVKRRLVRWSTVGLAVAVAYGSGLVTGVVGADVEPSRDSSVVGEAAEEIASHAASPVSREQLERAAIDGMLEELDDPWSRYFTPPQYRSFRSSLTGPHPRADRGERARFGITSAKPQSAAVRAGTPSGSVSVEYLPGDLMLIEVREFTRGVGDRVRRAVQAAAPPAEGIILDLRGNPGGLLNEAVRTASVFLAGGPVVAYKMRGHERRVLHAGGKAETSAPLVVLIDGRSASAAEVVAGALKQRNRAVVVGSPTFGKQAVQKAYRLADGSALKFTVGHYYTPAGRNISANGIVPDVYVSGEAPPEVARKRGREVLSGLLAALPHGEERN